MAVGLERLGCPLRPGDGTHLSEISADTDHVGDVHPGDAGEVLVGEAQIRADVGLGGAPGGPHHGELSCGIPVQRPLAGERLGQVAEQRQPGERVDRLLRVVVTRSLGGRLTVRHGVDATSDNGRAGTVGSLS